MDKFKIVGGNPLQGSVLISGAKNSALPILAATLLTRGVIQLQRVPRLSDIRTMIKLLNTLGAVTIQDDNLLTVDTRAVSSQEVPYDLMKTMRASIVVLGPLLARYGHAEVSLPGGCAIGSRPVNWHLQGLEAMGAEIKLEAGYIKARCQGRLTGADFCFPGVSVTGTENLMMAATLAEGETRLFNAACEPEIIDLANFLNELGAKIEGAGTQTITITGVSELASSGYYSIVADRIQAATYLIGGAMTQGHVLVKGVLPDYLQSILQVLHQAGAEIAKGEDWVELKMSQRPQAVSISTAPYPGYPTDAQAQIMALNTVAEGVGHITETIFENRFMHVNELLRLGADIDLQGHTAICRGKVRLTGAPVMATDLRASACLVLAALMAEGETIIDRVYHIDRGYEDIEANFAQLGANIKRIKGGSSTHGRQERAVRG